MCPQYSVFVVVRPSSHTFSFLFRRSFFAARAKYAHTHCGDCNKPMVGTAKMLQELEDKKPSVIGVLVTGAKPAHQCHGYIKRDCDCEHLVCDDCFQLGAKAEMDGEVQGVGSRKKSRGVTSP